MQGQTEIKIGKGEGAITYGVLFNNLALGEASHRFGVDLRSFNFLKSVSELTILVYCGIVAFCAKYQEKPISWSDFYDKIEADEIDPKEFEKAIKAFQESTVMSNFIQAIANKIATEETQKKKKAVASLKKGKLQSTEG
jgi:hypothetical protein